MFFFRLFVSGQMIFACCDDTLPFYFSLKFMTTGGAGLEWFISSDMFYVEVVLEPSGNVKDVKIHHEGKTERQVSLTIIDQMYLYLFLES